MLGTGLGVYIPVVLYAVCLLGCVLSLVWRPAIGIYLLIPLIPLQRLRMRLQEYPLGANLIVCLLLSVLLGALLRRYPLPRTSTAKLLLVFSVFTYFSLWLGVFSVSGALPLWLDSPRFVRWKDYMVLPLLFAAVATSIRTRREFQIAIALIVVAALLVARSGVLENLSADLSHYDEAKRREGPMGVDGANGLGALEAEMAAFLLAIVPYQKSWARKLAIYGVMGLTIMCLLFTFSRGAYIGFLAAVLFLGIVRQRRLLVLLLALLLCWTVVVPHAVVERINMTYDSGNGEFEQSAATRLKLWDDAMDLVASNPIIGTGYNTYEYMRRVGSFADTHNYYLKALVETGMIGLVLLLLVLAGFFRQCWQVFKRSRDPAYASVGLGGAALIVTVVVVNVFGDRWTSTGVNGLNWVLMGLVTWAGTHMDVEPTDRAVAESPPACDDLPGTTMTLVSGDISGSACACKARSETP